MRAAATRAERVSTPARRALGFKNSGGGEREREQVVPFLLRRYASRDLVNFGNGNHRSQRGEKELE